MGLKMGLSGGESRQLAVGLGGREANWLSCGMVVSYLSGGVARLVTKMCSAFFQNGISE
jgi:hypothetical protein